MIKGHCLDRRRLSVNGYEKTTRGISHRTDGQTYPRPRATGTSSQVIGQVIGLGKLCYGVMKSLHTNSGNVKTLWVISGMD
jgi:hypothetical protein